MRWARKLVTTLTLALTFAGCSEEVRVEPAPGQLLVFFDTDAPVPSSSASSSNLTRPTPLFDRLRVELFAPGASEPCAGCINEFALEESNLRAMAASVGVVPPAGSSGFRARVQMFLAAHASEDGSPEPETTIEVTVALPAVDRIGKTEWTIFLPTDAVGAPTGSLEAPAALERGRPTSSRVGTWAGAARVPCGSAPRPGEVCVPGGAYWIGGRGGPWPLLPAHDVLSPRLVVVSPFFLDASEVTVAAYRGTSTAQVYWNGKTSGDGLLDFCTNTKQPGPHENFPANCVSWTEARTHCQGRGADLPTEAQWEFAAGGMFGRSFVWGEDSPQCADAVFSRLGYGLFKNSVATCRPPLPPGGPDAIGTGARDRLELPTGTVVDLAGNVLEWAADAWNRRDEECWKHPGIYVDPKCEASTSRDGKLRSIRGGEWRVPGAQLARRLRSGGDGMTISPEVGFRCARPAR